MQKTYVIFTGTIAGMGGAQLYVSNKASYLESRGWQMRIFSDRDAPILIPALQAHRDGIFPELHCWPQLLRRRDVERTLETLLGYIGSDPGEILVESNTPHMSAWAELTSQKRNAKHFLFLLDEQYPMDPGFRPYFQEKFRRKELAVINRRALGLLFPGQEIPDPQRYLLSAAGHNAVADVRDPRLEAIPFEAHDDTVCCLGRLNKNYIPAAVEAMEQYAARHPERTLGCLFIGGEPEDAPRDTAGWIRQRLEKYPNVRLYLPGFVYPIPESLFSKLDLGIASAGSARILAHAGVPTVSMDAFDGQPIGILGYTTGQTLCRDGEARHTLAELMEQILLKGALKAMPCAPVSMPGCAEAYEKHEAFLAAMPEDNRFFDVLSLRPTRRKNRIKRGLLGLFGLRGYLLWRKTAGKRRIHSDKPAVPRKE